MPQGSTTKYNSKDLVSVTIADSVTTSMKYAFLTNIPAADRTTLGQTAVDAANIPIGMVIGSHFPKPRRASRRETARYTSSFCSSSAIDAVRAAGWRVSKGRGVPKLHPATGGSSFVVSVAVPVRGTLYGWRMPHTTYSRGAGDLTNMGIDPIVGADLKDLAMYPNFPRPPRAAKIVAGTGEEGATNLITTFYDPDRELPEGWTQIDQGRYEFY